ncbi:MAG: hypothetical protein AAEJ04_01555 [Planctomycetota bacterium]
MEGGPLLSDWWVKESQRFVPYLNISAQLDNKPDQEMMSAYDLRGFPSFVFLDTDGVLLFGKEPYWRPDSPVALEDGLGEVEAIFQLRKRVAENPDDEIARARLTLIEGLLNPARANAIAMEEAAAVEGVPVELVDQWRASRMKIRFLSVFEPYRIAYREDRDDKLEKRARAVTFCYQMIRAGERVSAEEDWFRPFWILAFDGALEASDKVHAMICFEAYTKAYGHQDRYVKTMESKIQVLEAEKSGGAGR